jgi:hypothetical protein
LELDFFDISKTLNKGIYYVKPRFLVTRIKDLMIRGKKFYAVWLPHKNRWSTDYDDVVDIVDDAVRQYCKEHNDGETAYKPMLMYYADSGVVDSFNKYVEKQMHDNYQTLNSKLIFSNMETKREDYSTQSLDYPLQKCDIPAYTELMTTLYDEDELKKLEWAIGAVISGDSKWIQKMIVLSGPPKSGKSTFLKIVRMLFGPYCGTVDLKAIVTGRSDFALESIANNPLVAVTDDTDLSKCIDNTMLNSLISHEPLVVNKKYTSLYTQSFQTMIFAGSNYDVRITDSQSGIIRRLIDVEPSGNLIPFDRYSELMKQIKFELPGIAYHCLQVYNHNKDKYEDYIPVRMLRNTNYVYAFLEENCWSLFAESPNAKFQDLWLAYNGYVEMSKIQYPHNRQEFKKELRPYFEENFNEYIIPETGKRCYGYFKGFKFEKFGLSNPFEEEPEQMPDVVQKGLPDWLKLNSRMSIFDKEMTDMPAQYANDDGIPTSKWANCKTLLKDIQTTQTHFVKVPSQHIVIDLDIRGEDGQKSAELNLQAAKQFPPTYAEYSKSGAGLHLHYWYDGDVEKLSRIFDNNIEVKVFTGNSSLRRRLTLCNNLDISHIASGLPQKGDDVKMIDSKFVWDDKRLHAFIKRCLRKEHHGSTAPEVQFIFSELQKAYDAGVKYDVSDLRSQILAFANGSTNQSEKCIKLVKDMKFKAKIFEEEETQIITESYITQADDRPIAFFDIEIFPNLFVVCFQRDDSDVVEAMVNPTPSDVEYLINNFRLIGFNNLNYDNHMVYAAMMGYSVEGLYNLSKRIISGDKTAKFSEAYNLSYTDIYDFAIAKQSLKKWEIAMGMHHLELGLPWDEPVPKNLIEKVVAYCKWDVKATKKLFYFLEDDWNARRVLAELSGLTVNHSTNAHTQQIIFGDDKHPQDEFVYTDLSEMFPGYEFKDGKSTYMGIEVGEGGWAHGEPGIWLNAFLDDIASMHPHSLKALNAFGDKYTKRYYSLVETRVYIKHGEEEKARAMFDGRIGEIADKLGISLKGMSKALKLPINSVYGLTAAKFPNRCRDPRNVDNIVAKRGALFMITLVDKIKKEGYDVAHIKTDSIKVPDAPEQLQEMIFDFARQYGYEFEHEATYDRMCLVNDAVYIAKYADGAHEYELSTGEKILTPWTATGTQFAVPYVFKTLFADEPINFDDCCEVKSSRTGPIYLDMNEDLPDVTELEKEYKKLTKKGASEEELSKLENDISKGHNYVFIGNVGQFTPVKSGAGGGVLVCKRGDKYVNVTGSTGYRWLESEIARENGGLDIVDTGYYRRLCDDAIDTINSFGDFDVFVNAENHKSPELRAIARNLPF